MLAYGEVPGPVAAHALELSLMRTDFILPLT